MIRVGFFWQDNLGELENFWDSAWMLSVNSVSEVFVANYITVIPELGGPGGQCSGPPIWQIFQPYSNQEGQILPTPFTTGTPNFFHLPASLY